MNEEEKFEMITKMVIRLNPSVETAERLISMLGKHIAWKGAMAEALESLHYGERN